MVAEPAQARASQAHIERCCAVGYPHSLRVAFVDGRLHLIECTERNRLPCVAHAALRPALLLVHEVQCAQRMQEEHVAVGNEVIRCCDRKTACQLHHLPARQSDALQRCRMAACTSCGGVSDETRQQVQGTCCFIQPLMPFACTPAMASSCRMRNSGAHDSSVSTRICDALATSGEGAQVNLTSGATADHSEGDGRQVQADPSKVKHMSTEEITFAAGTQGSSPI